MSFENLKRRTKKFALDIIMLTENLLKDPASKTLGGQLIRAATSVAASYRAACRAKSTADFISKLGTVEEEADESGFWLEMLVDAEELKAVVAAPVIREASDLTAVAAASINTARR